MGRVRGRAGVRVRVRIRAMIRVRVRVRFRVRVRIPFSGRTEGSSGSHLMGTSVRVRVRIRRLWLPNHGYFSNKVRVRKLQ